MTNGQQNVSLVQLEWSEEYNECPEIVIGTDLLYDTSTHFSPSSANAQNNVLDAIHISHHLPNLKAQFFKLVCHHCSIVFHLIH